MDLGSTMRFMFPTTCFNDGSSILPHLKKLYLRYSPIIC
jgi:hypothetical protein